MSSLVNGFASCRASALRLTARALFETLLEGQGEAATSKIFRQLQNVKTAAHSRGLVTSIEQAAATTSSAATTGACSIRSSLPWVGVGARGFRSSISAADEVKVVVPSMGDSISEGTLCALEKQVGDVVREDDVIAQVETDKVTIDVRYTMAKPGKVTSIPVKVDDTVVLDQVIAVVEQGDVPEAAAGEGQAAPEDEAPPPPKGDATPEEPKKEEPAAAPGAKPVPQTPAAGSDAASPPQSEPPSEPPFGGPGRERRVKMTRMRKRVAERLKGAQNTYAMLSTFNEIDMTNLIAMRNKYKDAFLEKHNVKLGFMSAFVKAAADALMMVPAVNAVIDGDDIVYRDYVDISIAVATPKGLVVPVLRDCDKMSYAEIEKTINRYGAKARDGTLSIDEMAGGTFTISNGGVFGSMLSTPIINPPQSAILGMHATINRPMVVGKEILPRPMMYVALTYDHRLIDGREAVTFLRRVKEVIEDPSRLLLEL
uniref:dihydrolipoyllysine-residue succinyltransferase n=1 Tax=Tetraselmis sp. GSL018 TaxID=582737 RepID=A0A061SJ96_9CHLO